MTINLVGWNIIAEVGSFLDGIEALRLGKCDAIYGKFGGILVLDKREGVVYAADHKKGIYFSVEAYLSPWRLLKKKEIVVKVKMSERAKERPKNFKDLPPDEQWKIDKRLGILDWDGSEDATILVTEAVK